MGNPQQVIAIFDIGKTNKKIFLFNEQYEIVYEHSEKFDEIKDEDGFPCENLDSLIAFVEESLAKIFSEKKYEIKAINFTAYGASFVYIDDKGKPIPPLYNYLKPYSPKLLHKFYDQYGGQEAFAYRTASPVLGNLNSGMQLY